MDDVTRKLLLTVQGVPFRDLPTPYKELLLCRNKFVMKNTADGNVKLSEFTLAFGEQDIVVKASYDSQQSNLEVKINDWQIK